MAQRRSPSPSQYDSPEYDYSDSFASDDDIQPKRNGKKTKSGIIVFTKGLTFLSGMNEIVINTLLITKLFRSIQKQQSVSETLFCQYKWSLNRF